MYLINISSNLPTSTIRPIPKSLNIRVNRLSSSKEIFENHKEIYNEALHNSGYKKALKNLETKRKHYNNENDISENHMSDDYMNMNNIMNKNKNKN